MRDPSLDLKAAVRVLRRHYGAPEPLPISDPFELVLWENVAYLAPPSRRRDAFEMLRRDLGTAPASILAAPQAALERVTAHGILKSKFAAKLRSCARIVTENFAGDLRPVVRGDLAKARRALRLFPGIGAPGADKILLFTGASNVLAPDSNALRVLVRLGFVREQKSYAATYAASQRVAAQIATKASALREAHLLLQQHGQSLCKRNTPQCDRCPLEAACDFAGGRGNAAERAMREKRLHPAQRPAPRASRARVRPKS